MNGRGGTPGALHGAASVLQSPEGFPPPPAARLARVSALTCVLGGGGGTMDPGHAN